MMTPDSSSTKGVGRSASAKTEMSAALFAKLSQFIQATSGIRMPPEKRIMLQMRLQKRMRALGYDNYEDYVAYVFSPQGGKLELQSMIDVVTTNKTDFFREPYHFEYMTQQALPELTARFGNKLNVWSAPCSKGHEAYTLAMVMAEYALAQPGFDFEIFGADLSGQAIEMARHAVYPHPEIEPIDMALRKKYLLRGKQGNKDMVRIAPALRQKTTFARMNFMDNTYGLKQKFHLIMCRNMLIYFEPPVQQAVVGKLVQHLHPGGLFITGHAESLGRTQTRLVQIEPTIYQLPEA